MSRSRAARNAAALAALVVARPVAAAGPAPTEVTVRGERDEPALAESTVSAERARRGAGTQDDPVKALETLPGAARSGPRESGLFLWGSEPLDTRLELDGMELPWLFHGSGVRSVVPAGLLATLRMVPGGFGPARGRGTGGLVALESRRLDLESVRYRAHADLLDAGALLSVPVAQGVAASIGGRYGYVDRLLPAVTDEDVGRLYTVPAYHDFQARVAASLGDGGTLDVGLLGSGDRASRTAPSTDPGERPRELTERRFSRIFARFSGGAGAVRHTALVYAGRDRERRELTVGSSGSLFEVGTTSYGARLERRRRFGEGASLRFGLDVLGAVSSLERAGTLTLPPREGDPFAFGEHPGPDYSRESYRAHVLNVAPFAEAVVRFGDVGVVPGVRLNAFLLETDQTRPAVGRTPALGRSDATLPVEPRIRVFSAFSSGLEAFASVGRYHQAPSARDLGPRFGNPELPPSSATHVVVGERLTLPGTLELGVTAFGKWLSALAVRSAEASPRTARALVPSGEGRAFGIELSARGSLHGFTGTLAATMSRSERRADAAASFRLFDQDQPLVAAASLLRRVERWSFAALARYASGAPRTPVQSASYNVSLGRYEPRFSALNSARLPAFVELDLRVDRSFSLGPETELAFYLDLLNVTARRNAEELVYSADYRERATLTGLPPLAVIGMRLER